MATYGLDLLSQFCLESTILRPFSRLWRPRKIGALGFWPSQLVWGLRSS